MEKKRNIIFVLLLFLLPLVFPQIYLAFQQTGLGDPHELLLQPFGGADKICIVTAEYGANASKFDKLLPPPQEYVEAPDFEFFAFTNQADYDPPKPWSLVVTANNKEVKHLKRYVTQSRYGKFLAWKEPQFSKCRAIFYHDGQYVVNGPPERFRRLVNMIELSSCGLMQFPHPEKRNGLKSEFKVTLGLNKDSKANIDASLKWLQSRPDYDDEILVYGNYFFGYNPRSKRYQTVSQEFWNVYSQEKQSIRDQALWAYTLWHNHLSPIQFPFLDQDGKLYRFHWNNQGFGGHLGGHHLTVKK